MDNIKIVPNKLLPARPANLSTLSDAQVSRLKDFQQQTGLVKLEDVLNKLLESKDVADVEIVGAIYESNKELFTHEQVY